MADRNTLGLIGYILCGVTAAVMLIGAVVVTNHISGHLNPDGGYLQAISPAAAKAR